MEVRGDGCNEGGGWHTTRIDRIVYTVHQQTSRPAGCLLACFGHEREHQLVYVYVYIQ